MLVNCVVYRQGSRLEDVPLERISDYLDQPGCLVWVALRDPSNAELEVMRREFDLPPLAIEDAGRGHLRPKIDEYGNALLMVMQLIEFTGGELNLGEVSVCTTSRAVCCSWSMPWARCCSSPASCMADGCRRCA